MPTRIVEGQLPYSGGTGIGIDTNKVISVLLREEDNLIHVNGDNELYTDLQLAVNITPSSDFPVGVTVGKVLEENGWSQNGLILNWKTTSGDYARWLYGADGKIYFDGGQGTWKQVYYSEEVDALFTALRGELATVAFTGDYNDLINRPAFLQVQADWNQTDADSPDYIKNKPTIPVVNDATLTIQKNGTNVATFTANSSTNATANITVPSVIDNVTSTSTSDALSANQGKELQDQIDDLKAMGRFLSLWDASTGQPISFPLSTPYTYQTGDYFLVETISSAIPPVNYRPNGSSYTGTASSTAETEELEIGDLYIYDGSVWLLQINHGKTVSFANLAGQPSDNANLATALNAKADTSSLATVATTGDYDDLTNKPTIPAAQVNSDWNANSGVAQILNKPTIPTDTNQLTNGAGYQTANDVSTSISTAIAGKADATDLNTKTFYLSSTSDLTTAQAAYDWYVAGKNPIIVYNKKAYILYNFITTGIKFYRAGVDNKDVDNTKSGTAVWYIYFSVSSDTVTSITNSSEVLGGYYLRTGKNYSTPYTPEYDGSPATKKYVDDGLSNKQATLVSGNNIKSINNNSLLGSGDLSIAEVPSGGTNGQVLTQTQNGPSWENPTGGGSDIEYVTQAEYNQLTPDPDTHYFIYTSSTPTDRPDITSFYYTSSATTGKVNCHSLCCVPSGEYVYVTDGDGPIYEYYLSDSTLNTLTYVTSKSGIKSRGSYVKEDGTKFYSQTDSSPYLYMAEMSTPYDISTATSTTYTNSSACACEFSPDGVYFYYRYGSDTTVCQDTLSTPRDLSTKSSTRNQSLTNMSGYYGYDIRFSPTGLKMYICGRPTNRVPGARVFQYNLGTAWDISTAVYFGYIELPTSYGGQGFSIGFCNNGTRLFAHTCTNNARAVGTIVQYDAR